MIEMVNAASCAESATLTLIWTLRPIENTYPFFVVLASVLELVKVISDYCMRGHRVSEPCPEYVSTVPSNSFS